MNENSSQTIKELSEDKENKNLPELDNDSVSQNEEDLSFEKKDIPSADSSSSRTNRDFDNAGFTQEEFASLLGKYDYNFKPGDLVKRTQRSHDRYRCKNSCFYARSGGFNK